MIFLMLRGIFYIFFFVVFILILKTILSKKEAIPSKRRKTIFLSTAVLLLWYVFLIIPVERGVFSFSSPKIAFIYENMSKPLQVISGKTTDLVIGEDDSGYILLPLEKTDNRWSLGDSLELKKVFWGVKDKIDIIVYQYEKSDEYYVSITCLDGVTQISDSHNSEFYELSEFNELFWGEEIKENSYYAYVNKWDNTYLLTVNEVTYALNDFTSI